jgi:hypothetical protein
MGILGMSDVLGLSLTSSFEGKYRATGFVLRWIYALFYSFPSVYSGRDILLLAKELHGHRLLKFLTKLACSGVSGKMMV